LVDGNTYYQLKDASGNSGSGIYGAKDLIGNVWEPFIDLGSTTFKPVNGDGQLSVSGNSDVVSWSTNDLRWGNFWSELAGNSYNFFGNGFRLCRSAE
jgi:formylglycine-generating enzyme required for sulfatase activity